MSRPAAAATGATGVAVRMCRSRRCANQEVRRKRMHVSCAGGAAVRPAAAKAAVETVAQTASKTVAARALCPCSTSVRPAAAAAACAVVRARQCA